MDPQSSPPLDELTQLVSDFLQEWPRRFLWSMLILTGAQGRAVSLTDLAIPWETWCAQHGADLDARLDPWSDTSARRVYEELLGYLLYALLSHAADLDAQADQRFAILRAFPSETPFGPLDLRPLAEAYDASHNPVQTFADRVRGAAGRYLGDPTGLPHLAAQMGQVALGVAELGLGTQGKGGAHRHAHHRHHP